MDHPLQPRERCMETLRGITRKEGWLERTTLFFALELLDLDKLNQVLAYAKELEDAQRPAGITLADALRKERFS